MKYDTQNAIVARAQAERAKMIRTFFAGLFARRKTASAAAHA